MIRRRTQLPTKTFRIRQYRRVPVHCSLYFSNEKLYGTGTVWNLSIGGWRVDSDQPIPVGTTLALFVMLPDGQPTVLVDQATVRWSQGQELGLSIRSIQPIDAERLKAFVAESLP